jgi:tetratricopeptide (TPR) repeat protein
LKINSKFKFLASFFCFIAGVGLLATASCTTTKNTSDSGGSFGNSVKGSWPERMQTMAHDLEELMPYVYSQNEFSSAENRSKIQELISNFEKSVELVPQHMGEKLLGGDPLIKYAISRLKSNTTNAAKAFNENHLDFSRNVLRENLGLCFSCHSTTQFGPQASFSKKIIDTSFRISPTERAEFYVATRQFDQAIDMLQGILKSPGNTLDDPHLQIEALRKYLSLQTRVKKDPAAASALLEDFLNNKKLPYFIATDAQAWQHSLQDWIKEKSSKTSTLERAKVILKKAKEHQSADGYQTAFIEFLRASSLLHDGLRENAEPEYKAEVYYNLGICYDALSEMGTWDLPEVYFEACVRTVPGTPLSQKCYKDFERTIVLGFSGSAGIFIPKEERDHLDEMKTLSGLK